MTKDNLITGAVIVALLLSGLSFFGGDMGPRGPKGDDGRVGASVGPDHTNTQNFFANFTIGGDASSRYATTSTATTYVLTATELRKKNSLITWNNGRPTLTLTTMASTSAPFSGMKVGEMFTQTFYNSSTTANAITFAAGTGVDLQEMEGGTVVSNLLEGATLTFIKKANTDIMMLVAPWQVAD